MRLPTFFLNQTAEVKHYKNSGAYGPVYDGGTRLDSNITLDTPLAIGSSYTVRCRIEPTNGIYKRGMVTASQITPQAKGIFPIDANIAVNTKIVSGGKTYDVLEVYNRGGYTEAWLK
jgi:hypothetical protein